MDISVLYSSTHQFAGIRKNRSPAELYLHLLDVLKKMFSVSHIGHPPALRLLPSSPLLFSFTMVKLTLTSDIHMTLATLNHCHSSNTLLILPVSAILCLCLSHPYSPCTTLSNCVEVLTSIYFYFPVTKLLLTWRPTPLHKILLLWGKGQVGKRRRQPALGTCDRKAEPFVPKCAHLKEGAKSQVGNVWPKITQNKRV